MSDQELSFREQTAQRLQAEREGVAPAAEAPPEPEGAPVWSNPFESSDQDVVADRDNVEPDEALSDESEFDDEPTDDIEANDDGVDASPEYLELQEKYKTLEAEFTRRNANRKEVEASLDKAQEAAVTTRHALEDKLQEADQLVSHFAGMATRQLQQLQSVNPATLPPEQQAQYYQQLNMATQQVQQFDSQLQGLKRQQQEQREFAKKREAEIAIARLKTRIPDWGQDKYGQLAELAGEYGYTQQEFFDTTDYRMMVILNELQQSRNAGDAVKKTIKQRKANPPKSRAAKSQARNDNGQFAKAQQAFHDNPNQRGAFAAMKAQQLKMERNRR